MKSEKAWPPSQTHPNNKACSAELLFNSAALTLGDGKAACLHTNCLLPAPRWASSGSAACLTAPCEPCKEYNEKAQYLHLNPVKARLVGRTHHWRRFDVNQYSGMTAVQPMRRCGVTIDRVSLPLDSEARI